MSSSVASLTGHSSEDDLDSVQVNFDGAVFELPKFAVYVLWGGNPDHVLYVGQSTNVLGRMGSHFGVLVKRAKIKRATVYRASTKEEMDAEERRLIRLHRPPWNTIGVPKEFRKEPGTEVVIIEPAKPEPSRAIKIEDTTIPAGKAGLTIEETCHVLGIKRTLLFELLGRGEIASIKVGRRRVIPTPTVMDYLRRRGAPDSGARQ